MRSLRFLRASAAVVANPFRPGVPLSLPSFNLGSLDVFGESPSSSCFAEISFRFFRDSAAAMANPLGVATSSSSFETDFSLFPNKSLFDGAFSSSLASSLSFAFFSLASAANFFAAAFNFSFAF